jgi:hypothetical protein
MFKFIRVTLAIGLAVGLAASQAQATKKITQNVAKCAKTIEAELLKNEKALISLFQKCEQALEKCLAKEGAVRDVCRDKLTAAGKTCSAGKLDLTDPVDAKAGKTFAKFKVKVAKKCDAALIADPVKLTESAVLDIDPSGLDFDAGDPNTIYGAGLGSSFFFESGCEPATSSDVDDCAGEELLARVSSGIASMNPRGWALLNEAGVSNALNIGELGVHNASGVTAAALQLFDGTMFITLPLSPSFSTKLRFGSVDATTDVVPITARSADATFDSVIVSGNIVCVRQPTDGAGKLCCGASCAADMGMMDYSSHAEHDSSGNNAGDGLLGGSVNTGGIIPDDSSCVAQVVNTHGGLTATSASIACEEDEYRIGACNQDTIGSLAGGGGAHFPVCADGERAGFPCCISCPTSATDECGPSAVAGCVYPCPACPLVGGSSALGSPMCNSPIQLVSAGAGATEGDLSLGIPIQFTIFPVALAGAFSGPDGIPCSPANDDTAPPGAINAIITTTGSADATVYDQNGIPYLAGGNPGGLNASLTVTGATTDCKTIASSVLTGTVSAGAFSGFDGSLGDTTTTILLAY